MYALGEEVVVVGEAADIVYSYEFQYILNTKGHFYIGYFPDRRGGIAAYIFPLMVVGGVIGKDIEVFVAGKVGIVFVGESAVDSRHTDYASQFRLVEHGDAVDDPAFEIVGCKEADIVVHHKLHGLHEVESTLAEEDRGGGGGEI